MLGHLIGEVIARTIGWFILQLVGFPFFVFTGWLVLKILTLGFRPRGTWNDQEEYGKVYWFGACIFLALLVTILIRRWYLL